MRYDKGRKDVSRRKIMDVASERFRSDGIAASGLATIMKDAGMTNGAFYPHFASKAELVRECLAAAMDEQAGMMRQVIARDGLEGAIAAYLSPEHRDNPENGCTLAALLPELGRQPPDMRKDYTDRVLGTVDEMAAALPDQSGDPQAAAFGVYAALIGTLQLARAVNDPILSDRILAAGAQAARAIVDRDSDNRP